MSTGLVHSFEASPAHRLFKIAVFNYGLPGPGRKRGGVDQVAHDLANALADRGHTVTVFSYDPPPPAARYATGPLPWPGFATSRIGRALTMGYLGNAFALAPQYGRFDVILAHGDSLLLPLTGKPLIRVMHGTALEEARSAASISRTILQVGVYFQELATAFLQRGTVAVSDNTRRFNPFIRRTILNGVDLSAFRPNASVRTPRPSILFVGALTGRKRGGWLIDQFVGRIRPRFPDAELHMVTMPGPAAASVTYHAGIETDALVHLYQQSWVYASPSTYEAFGLPYVEALACATPVVATPNPGSREVLGDGHFGRLAADGEFADVVCRLLGDSAERERLAQRGLQRADEYDVKRSAEMFERTIEELVH